MALDGAAITMDDSANRNAFGRDVRRQDVLGGALPTPAVFAPFVSTVKALTPASPR